MGSVTVNDARIEYTDTGGKGTPVLLIHGWPLNASMWEPQIEALADRWRFIAVDLKGFGSSDAPDDPSVYTMDAYADELAAVLDDAGAERAVLCGISMGGYICFAVVRKYPERVAGLVLADTRSEADPPEGIEKRTQQQKLVESDGIDPLIDALVGGALLADATRDKKPDVVEHVREIMDNPPAGYIGGLEAMKTRPDSTPDLTSIDVPVLVVVGEADTLIPVDVSRRMHEHIGGSRLVVIPEAGHLSNIEAPGAFNGALAEFLAETSGA